MRAIWVNTYVIGLSEFLTSVSELAELVEWAFFRFNVMLAELSLVLLFQSVNLASITVEAVIVWLVGEASKNLAWWVVEVSWSSIGVKTFSLISSFLAAGASWCIVLSCRALSFWSKWRSWVAVIATFLVGSRWVWLFWGVNASLFLEVIVEWGFGVEWNLHKIYCTISLMF